ncbi:Sensor histidine kinase ComP [Mycobacterium simulans]|uniref:histidine kinase n=1 Tax=Mycobacterium simulans TaxID=627089 RepID=A0A7Z7IIK3_9MYCO|nr:Sensor histidine kinase ComP [Mycobacterium simulans]
MRARLESMRLSRTPRSNSLGLAVAAAFIAAETVVLLLLKKLAPDNAFGVVYLIGVLVVATGWGAGLTMVMAVLSAIAYSYFRSWPDHGTVLSQLQDWVVFLIYVVVALVAHALAHTARTRATDAEKRRQQAEESGAALSALAVRQAALRQIATLVARGAPASEIFPAVADELAQCLDATDTSLWRYEPDNTATLVAAHDDPGHTERKPVGTRWPVDGDNIVARVARTGRPARVDDSEQAIGAIPTLIRELGLRAGVGTPIIVGGRLWGAAVVGSRQAKPLPPDSEQRIGEFTELVATAIANAEAHSALKASRARIVTAADDARRRLERDLHDGAQQRLISLALQLRLIEADAPPELGPLKAQISQAVANLAAASADLQEIARGIHPAIVSTGGLGPALKALARRCPIPVRLNVAIEGRLSESAEIAAYYVVSEALTNVARHARASGVDIDAKTKGSDLLLSIRDDGAGGADCDKGSGIIGLIDRVEALGGHLRILSPPGAGTTLDIVIPQ